MRRRLLIVATIGICALLLAVGVAIWSIDSIVKEAIERYGSAATGVAVRVNGVHLSLINGTGNIDELTVANPGGFSSANVFSLGNIQVALERSTVRSNPIVVDDLSITAPQVLFEVNQTGESNIDAIRRHLTEYRVGGGQTQLGGGGQFPVATQSPAEAQRFIIKHLSIRGARVAIDADTLGGERMVMTLPDTDETDIGSQGDGATGPEVAIVVVRSLVRDVAATVAAAKVQRSIEKGIGGETGKAVGEGVGDAVKGVGKAFNKLFGEHGQ